MKDWICLCDGCTKECKGQGDPLRPCDHDEFYIEFEIPDEPFDIKVDVAD